MLAVISVNQFKFDKVIFNNGNEYLLLFGQIVWNYFQKKRQSPFSLLVT